MVEYSRLCGNNYGVHPSETSIKRSGSSRGLFLKSSASSRKIGPKSLPDLAHAHQYPSKCDTPVTRVGVSIIRSSSRIASICCCGTAATKVRYAIRYRSINEVMIVRNGLIRMQQPGDKPNAASGHLARYYLHLTGRSRHTDCTHHHMAFQHRHTGLCMFGPGFI